MYKKITALLVFMLTVVPCSAYAQHKIRVINAESGLSRAEIEDEFRKAIRTLRSELDIHYKITSYREITDRSPEDLSPATRALWFEGTTGTKKGYITVAIYNALDSHGYGRTKVCKRNPFISIAYKRNVPPLWLKFVLAHEIGHTLGAGHENIPNSVLATYNHEPLTLMHPAWDIWFWKKSIAPELVEWKFSQKAKLEIAICRSVINKR